MILLARAGTDLKRIFYPHTRNMHETSIPDKDSRLFKKKGKSSKRLFDNESISFLLGFGLTQ